MQKALRGLETGVDGFDEKTTDAEIIEKELAAPAPDRLWYVADAFRIGMSRGGTCTSSPGSIPGFSRRFEDIVRQEQALRGKQLGSLGPASFAGAEARRLFRSPPRAPAAGDSAGGPRRRSDAQACARYSSASIPAPPNSPRTPPTCIRPMKKNAKRARAQRDKIMVLGGRPQPHRSGHRVRLLLRACRAGAARRRLRDHHGQLQPGNRVDRLRHLRSPVLRAAHPGRCARDRGAGKARRA